MFARRLALVCMIVTTFGAGLSTLAGQIHADGGTIIEDSYKRSSGAGLVLIVSLQRG